MTELVKVDVQCPFVGNVITEWLRLNLHQFVVERAVSFCI